MKAFEMTVQVDRSPEEVFAFLCDLENDPTWRREFVDAKHHSEGAIGVGTTTSVFGQALGRRSEIVYQVSAFEPNSSVTWTSVKNPLPLTFWRKVEGASGGTRASLGYSADFHGFLALLSPLLERLGKRALAGDLPTLKRVLEAGAS